MPKSTGNIKKTMTKKVVHNRPTAPKRVKKWAQDLNERYWAEVKGCHQTKSLLGPVLGRDRSKSILALGWAEVKLVI